MKKIILILLVFVSSSVFADRNSSVVVNRAENNISGIQRSVLNRASVISNKSKRSDNSNNISRQKSYRSLNNQNKSSVVGRSAKNQVVRSSNAPKQTKVNSVNRQIKTENLRHTNKNITSRSAVSNLKKTFVNNVGVKQSYSVCKDTFFKCMDEFCANKDKQLRRCACSSRSHDFDEARTRISDVEQKMLSFNERLLSVNMEEGDAKALSKATEGETAFQKEDTSKSKRILDEISSKLKKAGSKSSFEKDMSSLSLSMDSANSFDDLDSALGQETTLKEGVELYKSALPVCLDIATEVCNKDDVTLAEETYQMAIEKDCNTIEKTYEILNEKTISKIHEGNALLDMSRLDLYKKNNSDSALLCIKKIQDAMYSKSVCGENLEFCLDYTGQYVDNKTGKINLNVGKEITGFSTLINKPTEDFKDNKKVLWSNYIHTSGGETENNSKNKKFAEYIKNKYKNVKSATKVCKNMKDAAFEEFLEDSLKKIKAKQDEKIEELKQSCTILLSECMTKSYKQIADFDNRAISVFGVKVFRTAYEMCNTARETCNALLNEGGKVSPNKNPNEGIVDDWGAGIEDLNLEIAYQKIRNNCMEVGKQCIIQQCRTETSNFELCKNPLFSINRRNILSRSVCFKEVQNCINDIKLKSGTFDIIQKILEYKNMTPVTSNGSYLDSFYKILYNNTGLTRSLVNITHENDTKYKYNSSCSYDKCDTNYNIKCIEDKPQNKLNDNCIYLYNIGTDFLDRFTESLWGHCEKKNDLVYNNMIRIVNDPDKETLLSWFAKQTNTDKNYNSCYDDSCGINEELLTSLNNPKNKMCYNKNKIYNSSVLGQYGCNNTSEIGNDVIDINFNDNLVLSYGDKKIYCIGDISKKDQENQNLFCNKWIIVKNELSSSRIATYNGDGNLDKNFQTFYISGNTICFWHPAKNANKDGYYNLSDNETSCGSQSNLCTDNNKCYIKNFSEQ